MSARLAKRLLVVGWDAADWIVIDRLFAAGRMPVLRRLVESGVRADLSTLEPRLSPLLWTSIATGKTADRHGILNFVEPKPEGGGLRVASSTSRRTKALWNVLSQSGLETRVVGWYASHPAEPIRGSVVTNLLQEGEPRNADAAWPLAPGTVHPAGLAEAIAAARQRTADFPREVLRELLPRIDEIGAGDARVTSLVKLMSAATSIERAALVSLAAPGAWDAAFVFLDAIDVAGHAFMQFVAPKMAHVSARDQRLFGGVMDRIYEWHDSSLGRLLAAAGDGVTSVVVSDHGFHSDHLRPNLSALPPERRMELESSWHRPQGILVMSGPGVRRDVAVASPTILDVAPTALALLGLPAGEDFDGRVLAEALEVASPADVPARIPSWDEVEGDDGRHPADLRVDAFESADALQQLVDLGYMAALPADAQGQLDLVRRESLFNLAVVLLSRGRIAEAVPHLERLVGLRPEESRYVLCLTNAHLALGRHAEAIAQADSALARDPASVELRLLRVSALSLGGNDAEARAQLDRLARLVDERPELLLPIASAHSACGRHADARRLFEAARRRDPREPAIHVGLARSQLALGGFEEAAGHALDALEITQSLPEAHLLLGAALAWIGEWAGARQSLAFALRLDRGQLDAHRFLALVAAKEGDEAVAASARDGAARLLAGAPVRPPEMPYGPAALAARLGVPAA